MKQALYFGFLRENVCIIFYYYMFECITKAMYGEDNGGGGGGVCVFVCVVKVMI